MYNTSNKWLKSLAALVLSGVLGAVTGCEQEETSSAANEPQGQTPACCCDAPSRNQAVGSQACEECCEEEGNQNPGTIEPQDQ